MLTTAEAAALLSERGVRVRGNLPSARTVEFWCRSGTLRAKRIGGPRRSIYLIEKSDLDTFEPPKQGRKRTMNVADKRYSPPVPDTNTASGSQEKS